MPDIYAIDEDGSGLRLTTALYYTPGGRSIQEVGIQPDIPVKATRLAAAQVPPRLRESDLEGHFTHEEADPAAVDTLAEAEDSTDDDVQLARALEVLKSWTYFERLRGPDAEGGSLQARASEPAS